MKFRNFALLIAIAGAVIACVSTSLHPRFENLPESMASQRAIYERTLAVFDGTPDPIPNWRNRVLMPWVLEGATRLSGLSYGRAYLMARWVTACLALGAFMALACRTVHPDARVAGAVTLLFALSLIPTFLHVYEIPSDFLDAAFFSALTLLALDRRRLAFGLVMAVALLNRESAIFALVVWFFIHGIPFAGGAWRRELSWCAGLGLAGTAEVTILRVINAAAPGATGLQTFEPGNFWSTNERMLEAWLARPSFSHPYFFLAAYAALLAVTVPRTWTYLANPVRRLFLAALTIFGLSVISNNLNELRIFIPSLVLTTVTLGSCYVRTPMAQPSSA